MNEVASLDLCKELYELSGWEDTHFYYGGHPTAVYTSSSNLAEYPAYSLGYLLRKLPSCPMLKKLPKDVVGDWVIGVGIDGRYFEKLGDTPENVCAELAIELFKQGILK